MILSDLPNSNTLASPLALAKPWCGMVSYRTNWKVLQPNQPVGGVPTNNPNDASFNWSFFDSAVAQAAAAGKKAWLRFVPQASSSPAWLQALCVNYVDTVGDVINLWWDTNFQAYVIAMIQAAGARYSSNPAVAAFTCNIAADHTGDWTIPNVGPSPSATGAANWQLASGFTCPAFNGTVVVTPIANQQVHNLWVVYIQNFGWFQITAFTGPNTNPSTVTLTNLGITGNASSGSVPASAIMQVSDIANLQGPVYGYTTTRLVNAITAVLSAAHTAWPHQVLVNECGRNGKLDPFPANPATPPVQESIGGVNGANPYTKAFPSSVSASNTLLAALTWNDATSSVTAFTDSLNVNSWKQVGIVQAQGRSIALFMYNNTVKGTCTVSATLSATPGVVRIALFELQGSNVYLDTAAVSSNGAATTSPSTGSITPGFSTDLVLAFLQGGNPVSAGPANWTFQTSSNYASAYFAPGSASAISGTFTQASAAYVTLIITLAGLDPATTYQYNCSTMMAQWAYANLPKGSFAIERDTYQAQTSPPSVALANQDGDSFYLPAQTLAGSSNTSGTTGVIPAGSLNYGQAAWEAWDPTGLYSPTTTASAINSYSANGGIPYSNPVPVFLQMMGIVQLYDTAVFETYEQDMINTIPLAQGVTGGGGAGGGGGTAVTSQMQFPFNRR